MPSAGPPIFPRRLGFNLTTFKNRAGCFSVVMWTWTSGDADTSYPGQGCSRLSFSTSRHFPGLSLYQAMTASTSFPVHDSSYCLTLCSLRSWHDYKISNNDYIHRENGRRQGKRKLMFLFFCYLGLFVPMFHCHTSALDLIAYCQSIIVFCFSYSSQSTF